MSHIKRLKGVVAALLYFSFPFTPGQAADPLPLWLDRVIEVNPTARASQAAWQSKHALVREARSLDDPMLGVDFMRMDSTGFDDIETTEYMLSQRVPWFGKRRAAMNGAELRAQAQGLRYLEMLRQLRADMSAAYWELWAVGKSESIVAENVVLLEAIEQAAHARYRSGDGIQADVLKASIARAEAENERENVKAEGRVAQARVNRLLSMPTETVHALTEDPARPALRWTLDEALHGARQYCCILLAYALEVEAAEQEMRLAKLAYAPDIEFRVAARQRSGGRGIDEYDTGMAINVPWLWRGKYQADRQKAEQELEMARSELQSEIDMTFWEVQELFASVESTARTLDLIDTVILPQTHDLVTSLRAAYESGNASFLELVEAQRQWSETRLSSVRTKAALGRAMAQLEALVEPWQDYEIETGLVSEEMRHTL